MIDGEPVCGWNAQPVPRVSATDIDRIIARDFAAEHRACVRELLDRYGSERWQRDADRVRAAALKLACGSIDGVARAIEAAGMDDRDVIGAAEYPGYMTLVSGVSGVSIEERREIIQRDWQQYQEWFAKA